MKTILLILTTFITIATYGQNPEVHVIFRFKEFSDAIIRVNIKNRPPTDFPNVKQNEIYRFMYSGMLGYQKSDTIAFRNSKNKVMTIVFKNDVQTKGHNSKIYFDIPKFIEGKTTVKLQELFKDDWGRHYTPKNRYSWTTEIAPYFYNPKRAQATAYALFQKKHPLLSPSDTLDFIMNGTIMDDGGCSAKLFFEIFKPLKDSLVPIVVFPGFTPKLCGVGFYSFDNTLYRLPSLYAKTHYYGLHRVNLDTGKYIFRFMELGEKRGYIFSDTVHYNTTLKVDKEKYNITDPIKISFKTMEGFGTLVKSCGPSITYHINLEQYNEKTSSWQPIGFLIPPPKCLAIYKPTSVQSQQLELTADLPYQHYKLNSSSKYRLSTIVYENQWKIKKLNCIPKTVYSDDFTIE